MMDGSHEINSGVDLDLADDSFSPLFESPIDPAPPTICCPLCRRKTDYIQTFHFLLRENQIDGVATGDLVRRHWTDIRDMTEEQRSDEITIHDYCWWITQRVFKKEHIDQMWVDEFTEHVLLLAEFLRPVPFRDEPHTLDNDIFAILKSKPAAVRHRTLANIPLPPETLQLIYSFLTNEYDIINLRLVLPIGPSWQQWKDLGRKYMLKDDLDPEINITILLQNLEQMPESRYPRTANYRTVWDNIELIREIMENPIKTQKLPDNVEISRRATCGKATNFIRMSIELPQILYLAFVSDKISGTPRLCGMMINGLMIGSQDGTWNSAQATCLRELRVVIANDCIAGMHLKDRIGWQDPWEGQLPDARSQSLKLYCGDDKLVVSYDSKV